MVSNNPHFLSAILLILLLKTRENTNLFSFKRNGRHKADADKEVPNTPLNLFCLSVSVVLPNFVQLGRRLGWATGAGIMLRKSAVSLHNVKFV